MQEISNSLSNALRPEWASALCHIIRWKKAGISTHYVPMDNHTRLKNTGKDILTADADI